MSIIHAAAPIFCFRNGKNIKKGLKSNILSGIILKRGV